MIVSDHFFPYGFEQDANISTMASGTCSGDRSPPALGACYTVTYTPTSSTSWAAIYWQYPNGNWGTKPGLPLAEGATKVSFYAKGETGTEVLTVSAGGINYPGPTTTADPYQDSFSAGNSNVQLTKSWAQYTLTVADGFPPLSTGYGPVLGGFFWEATASGTTTTQHFWIDSIVWEQ